MAGTAHLVANFFDLSNGVGGYNVTDAHDLTGVQMQTKMSLKCEICKKLGRGMIETCKSSRHFCCVSCVSDSYSKWVLNDLPESTMMMSCPVPGCKCAFKERKTNECMKKSELLEFTYENLDPHKSLLFLNLVETGALRFKCSDNNFADVTRQPTMCVETFDDHVKLHAHQKKCIFTCQICLCGDFIGTREEVQLHRAQRGCVVDLEAQNSKFKIEYLHRRTMKELAQRRQGAVPPEEDRHTVPTDEQASEISGDSVVSEEDSMEVSTLSTPGANGATVPAAGARRLPTMFETIFALHRENSNAAVVALWDTPSARANLLEENSVHAFVAAPVDAPSTHVNFLEENSVAAPVDAPSTLANLLEENSAASVVASVDAPSTHVNTLEEHSVASAMSSPTTLSTATEVNSTSSEHETVSRLSESVPIGMTPCTLPPLQSSKRKINSFFRLVKIKQEKEDGEETESTTSETDTASESTSPAPSPRKRLLDCDDNEDICTTPTKKHSTELYTLTDSELSRTNFVGLCQTLYDNLLMDCSRETASILLKLKRLGEDKDYLTKCNIDCIVEFLDLRKKDSHCDSSRERFLDSMIRKLTLSYSI